MRVLIAASGTGGHLIPAMAIARAIRSRAPDSVIEFVGAGRPLEATIVGPHGIVRHEIPMVGIRNRGLMGVVELVLVLPRVVFKSWKILSSFKPDVIVGVGGYASVPPVILGWLRGISTWIHEPELKPGLANHLLGFIADKVSVGFATARMPRMSRVVHTGHPVRAEILSVNTEVAKGTPLTHLLILGGSQGAEGIDRGMESLGAFLREHNLEVFHQCRKVNVDRLTEFYKREGVSARVSSYIEDSAAAFRWAHLIISRSGAGSVMEIGVVNRPAILVPYPAKGIQQRDNALILVKEGKALMVEEGDDFSSRLRHALETLLNPTEFFAMQLRPMLDRARDAADRIAQGIIDLAHR